LPDLIFIGRVLFLLFGGDFGLTAGIAGSLVDLREHENDWAVVLFEHVCALSHFIN
jgi:hypothetical protein